MSTNKKYPFITPVVDQAHPMTDAKAIVYNLSQVGGVLIDILNLLEAVAKGIPQAPDTADESAPDNWPDGEGEETR